LNVLSLDPRAWSATTTDDLIPTAANQAIASKGTVTRDDAERIARDHLAATGFKPIFDVVFTVLRHSK
jgi:hypothetical protein